ncbi:hypothetical protein AGRO_4328 [Agrobacterium sp. ATCC 31749]|nr:hypothetical protein AGRO_4328 [Agrobacterium sp. ATCC 31749]
MIGGGCLWFRSGHCGFPVSGCEGLRHGRAADFFSVIRRRRAA